MSKLENAKDKVVGKAKQIIAEVEGDLDLAQEGKQQVGDAERREQTDRRNSTFGKLKDLT